MGKGLRIAGWILALLVLLFIAGLVALQSPRVQTALGKRILQYMEDKVDADISFRTTSVQPLESFVIEDLLVLDRAPVVPELDTVLYVKHLSARFSVLGLLRGESIYVSRATLDGGTFNLVMEPDPDNPEHSRTNLERVFRVPQSGNSTGYHWGNLLRARSVDIHNLDFRMENLPLARKDLERGYSVPAGSIDWNHLSVLLKNAHVSHLKMADDLITVQVDDLDLQEQVAGLDITDGHAKKVRVGKGLVHVEDAEGWNGPVTHLILPTADFVGPLDDYSYFTERIALDMVVGEGSVIATETLGLINSSLQGTRFEGGLSAHVKGPVKDLTIENAVIRDLRNQVLIRADGSIRGLPDTDNTQLDFQVKEIRFTLANLGGFVKDWSPKVSLDSRSLRKLAPGEYFTLSGQVKGPLNTMNFTGGLESRIGGARMDITLGDVLYLQSRPLVIDAAVTTRDLDIGRITGIKALGPVSLETGLQAQFHDKGPELWLDSLKINRLHALDYDYSHISAAGTYKKNAFDGRITAADPNLNFLIQGVFNQSPQTRNMGMDFFVSLGYADLHALHIDPRERSKVSFLTTANFVRTAQRELLGTVKATDIVLEGEGGRNHVGDITVNATADDNLHRIRLDADFMEASYVGDHPLGDFVSDLKALVLGEELPALAAEEPEEFSGGTYDIHATVGDAHQVLNFILPGLYVENGTESSLHIGGDGFLKLQLESGRLARNESYVKDLRLSLDNAGGSLNGDILGSSISLGGSQLRNNRLNLYADHNLVGLGYSFDNESAQATRAEVIFSGELSRDQDGLSVLARALPSNIYYEGDGWGLSSGDILYTRSGIKVNRLVAAHEDEQILVDGGYSPTQADTLTVIMDKFKLDLLNTVLGAGKIPRIEGSATGRATVLSTGSSMPGLLAGIQCDSTYFGGKRLGTLSLNSVWNEESQRFDASLTNRLDGRSTIAAEASLAPSTKELQALLRLQQFNLGYVHPFLTDLFNILDGSLSGEISARGELPDLHVSSRDLKLDNGLLSLDFTRVPYLAGGDLALDDKGIHFTDIRLRDREGGSGKLSGSLLFDGIRNFMNMRTDIHAMLNGIKALELPYGVNSLMYGNVYASGRVDVTGPLDRTFLSIDASSTKEGDLHLLMNTAGKDRSREMLTFTSAPEEVALDPYEQMLSLNRKTEVRSSNVTMKMRVRASQELTAHLDLGEETSISANGNGTIEMDSDISQGTFTLGGDYTLSGGSMRFSVMNLVGRNFSLQEGSTIRFNGDVWDTDLDVTGVYTTKANMSNLLPSYDESGNQVGRRTVNCEINVSGKLKNPEVDFNIDIPDLDPLIQPQVEGAFNSEDKVQKQFLYLLLAGNFLPTEESGVTTNGTDVLVSNVSSIMTGQLNNIFQKLNIPLDLGLNYQSTQTGSNLFDVAVSTQLFNNRVLVNGTVGNKEVLGTTTNEVAGDIDIEIKLNRSGSLRLNLFSHSADIYTSYLDNSQRNGAGIAYQREFNSFRQFFRELFSSRRRREEQALENVGRPTREQILQIDSTGKSTPVHEQLR